VPAGQLNKTDDAVIDLRDPAPRGRKRPADPAARLVARIKGLLEGEPSPGFGTEPGDLAYQAWAARYHWAVRGEEASTNRQVVLFDSLAAAVNSGISLAAIATAHERGARWAAIVATLQRLSGNGRYVNSYRVDLESAARTASGLSSPEREIAALLLLHSTARWATTPGEVRFGIQCAQLLSRPSVTPTAAVSSILRPCLRWASANPASLAPGLLATLQLLGAATRPVLGEAEAWSIREALALVPATDELRAALGRLRPADRARVEHLDPDVRRPWAARLFGAQRGHHSRVP
jgi:hypothetical protein